MERRSRRTIQRLGRTPKYSALLLALLFASVCPSASAAAQETGKQFDTPGATIYYEVIGSGAGTPLVLVNGGPGFDHTYLHVSPAWNSLAAGRRVVFYDQRGNGRSTAKRGQTYSLADQIDDLDALRAHLGFERMDLLGHSWGGFLVMAYAARHPDRIAHLMIIDSAAPVFHDTVFLFKDVFPEVVERRSGFSFADEFGNAKATEGELREYLSMLFYSTEKRDAFLAGFSSSSFSRAVNRAVNQDIVRFDLNPEIRKFKFPVLVVTGRYDMNVAPSVAYKIHQSIPGSSFAVFERSGHMPFYEEPGSFADLLQSFLGK